jgi:C-terminal peptidase prc
LLTSVLLSLVVLAGCQVEQPMPTLAAAAPPVLGTGITAAPETGLPTGVPSTPLAPFPHLNAAHLSATASPAGVSAPTERLTARQLRIFDQLYDLVLDNYVYPDFNGLNWPAWGTIYRERVAAGMTGIEFCQAMTELVDKLNDGHSVFQSPTAADVTDAAIHGGHSTVGIGVETAPRPDRNAAVFLDVYPGSPAWNAGLRPHDSLLSIDGNRIRDGAVQLAGSAGSPVVLTVQTPGQHPRQVTVVRAPVPSPPPILAGRWQNGEIATILIRTFWNQDTASLLRWRLQELAATDPISGLVIDLRTNRGGSEHSLLGVLSLFADGTLGHFTRRDGDRPLIVVGENVRDSQTLPLVILVGRETTSYAEIFAGVLQSTGRARLVGTVTGGNVESIWPHDFEDGSRVWIAEEGFRSLSGGNWERDGIVPGYFIAGDWADFTAESDTQFTTAIQLLQEMW